MKFARCVIVAAALALPACMTTEPVTYLFKPGTTKATKQSDLDACRIASFREIPQSMATDYTPGIHTPGTLQCNTISNITTCNRIGAINTPGSVTSYDVNADLRHRWIVQCLQKRGYTTTPLPTCASAQQREQARSVADSGQIPQCAPGRLLD